MPTWHLLAVDPNELVVRVDPRLWKYPAYAVLDGRPLAIAGGLAPDREALSDHFRAATASWLSPPADRGGQLGA